MITQKQEPNNIHSVFIPEFYTWNTDTSGMSNFYFSYHLTDLDEEFFVGNTIVLEKFLSYNDPTEVLKSKTLFNFNPSITGITNIPDNAIVYEQRVQEKEDSATSSRFVTKTACRYSDSDFNPYDYIMNSGQSLIEMPDFLVSMPNQHRIRFTDDFTFRTYNGWLDSQATGTTDTSLYQGDIYTYIIEVFFSSSSQSITSAKFMQNTVNPYLNASQSDTYSATTSGSNYMIEIPAAINNWANNSDEFHLMSYVSGGTEYSGATDGSIDIDSSYNFDFGSGGIRGVIEYYDFWMIADTDRGYDQISIKHRFYPIEDCTFTSINVAWENTKGGVDYYLFEKANEKSIKTNKTTYDQSMNYLNLTDEEVQNFAYNKRTVVYRNETTSILELNTDWLTQDEINGFEDMFKSTEVYVNYKGSWKYVVNLEKGAVIFNKKRKGLKKYKLNFQLSEKTIR